MSARVPEPCDGVTGEHAGPVRFFVTGWKCVAHRPGAETAVPPAPPTASDSADQSANPQGARP